MAEDDVAADDNFVSLFSKKVKDLPKDWKCLRFFPKYTHGDVQHKENDWEFLSSALLSYCVF